MRPRSRTAKTRRSVSIASLVEVGLVGIDSRKATNDRESARRKTDIKKTGIKKMKEGIRIVSIKYATIIDNGNENVAGMIKEGEGE